MHNYILTKEKLFISNEKFYIVIFKFFSIYIVFSLVCSNFSISGVDNQFDSKIVKF